MLDNARDEKIHELNFPGGTGARGAGVATPRAPSRVGNGPTQGKLIANRADRFNDLVSVCLN